MINGKYDPIDGLQLVQHYRKNKIEGYFIDLVPVSEKYAKDIVSLRNTDRVHHNLNQTYNLTEEKQLEWIKEYYKRDNDIYWCILDKKGEFLGTYRVYDIDFGNKIAEIGSTIIKEERARERPYMIEATLLAYMLAFNQLKINKIVAHIRDDNAKVRAFDIHIGAEETDNVIINGVNFVKTEVDYNQFNYNKLNKILLFWINRCNK